jgi:hypothetical protein
LQEEKDAGTDYGHIRGALFWELSGLGAYQFAHVEASPHFGNTSAKDAHISHVSCWGLRRFHDRARMPKIAWVDSK